MNNERGETGIGFCGLLTVVFIALKLTGVVDWSWVWVLAPMWIGIAGVLLLLLGALFIAAGADGLKYYRVRIGR